MNAWLIRGLGMALVHFVSRLLLALAITAWPTHGTALRTITLLVVVLVAVVWGGIDGINDRRAHPDPDDSADFTMVWLKASVVAGLVSGFVTWIVSLVSPIAITSNTFFFELTSGAAFTVLMVFVPTLLAIALGRLLAGRDSATSDAPRTKTDRRELVGAGAQAEYSRQDAPSDADTEVFEPVTLEKRDDERTTTWQEPS